GHGDVGQPGHELLPRTMRGDPDVQPDAGPFEKGLVGMARTAPVIGGAMVLQSQGVPSPLSFGTLVGSESLAEGEDISTALGRGVVGAAVPAAGTLGKELAVKGLN